MKLRPDIAKAMYSRHLNAREAEAPRYAIGASDLAGDCPRKLRYTWRWALGERFSGEMLRLFNRGHREEPELVADLKDAGFEVSEFDDNGRQWRFGIYGDHFRVNLDGIIEIPRSLEKDDPDCMIIERRILEFKTMNLRRFEETTDMGVAFAMPGYYRQMQAQLAVTKICGEDFAGSLFVAVCKNNDKLHVEEIDPDPRTMRHLVKLVQDILADKVPARLDPKSRACRWCHYSKICHDRALDRVERNCRTCQHSKPVLTIQAQIEPCEWECTKGHEFGKVCTDYAVNPDF